MLCSESEMNTHVISTLWALAGCWVRGRGRLLGLSLSNGKDMIGVRRAVQF